MRFEKGIDGTCTLPVRRANEQTDCISIGRSKLDLLHLIDSSLQAANHPRMQITDAQVNYLIDEFDDNILPIESEAFSVAPDRDGSRMPTAAGLRCLEDFGFRRAFGFHVGW